MSIISKYSKTGYLKYISHLDVLRFIQRAVKRAGINAKYSEGFNPHMKTSFGFPLSLGTESIGEYFELELNEDIAPDKFIEKMNAVMPKEMQILKADYTNESQSLMARCAYAQYLISIESQSLNMDKLNDVLKEMLDVGVVYNREKKNKKNKTVLKELNTKDYIKFLKAEQNNDFKATIQAVFVTSETGSMRVDEFLKLLEEKAFNIDYNTIMKVDALDKDMKTIL
ncbi:MAG: TIGR03936 family radical SAM-associated protein [Sedimentibacter sp.]